MSETIPAAGTDILLFRHQEIQENLNVESLSLLLQLFKKECLTQEQFEQLLACGRTPWQKINLLLSYLLISYSVNPLRSLICSLNSTPDNEPHQKLAAILSASIEVPPSHSLMPLKVSVDFLAAEKTKEKLHMLIDIHALLPLLNKQQLLSVSEYCAIVDTESQTLKVELLLKSLQRHPDGVSKLVHCLREDKADPLGHSQLANFITELDDRPLHVEEHLSPVTSLMRKLKKRYRERRVQLHAQWPPLLNQEIVEPRLALTELKNKTETESSSSGSTDGPILLDYKALFKNDTHERKVHKVVMLGEAGAGKSTFCEKLLCDWGEDTGALNEYQLVFFVPLCMKEVASSKSVNDLLSHIYPELGDSVGKYLGDGERCLFILDGWDELPDSQFYEGSIFHDLLADKCLPFASVIVTSRTTASRDLYKMPSIDRFVILQGFSKVDIESFVKLKFITPEQSAPLLQRLSDNPVLESVCTNPLNCVIICYLWKSTGKSIPLKATELCTQIILSIVRREIDRNFPQYKDATSLDELLPLMDKLCNLAFIGLKQNKTEFTREEIEGKFDSTSRDLPIVFQSLGLLQSRFTFTAVDCSLSFHFNNVTFQEYLAARYLLSLSELDQIAASRIFFKVPRFQKVWQFYFGLQCERIIPKDVVSKCLKSNISDYNYKLHLCRCAYEADTEAVNERVAANLKGKFGPYEGKLSAYDCLSIAHVISQTRFSRKEVSLKIMLKYSHFGDRGMMEIVKSLIQFQFQLKVEKLLLPFADITAESFRYMSDACLAFTPLKELDLTSNNVGPSGATVLAHILEVGSSLQKINLKNVGIKEDGAANLIPYLVNHKQLTELVLSGNSIGVLGVEQLVKCLQGLQELKVFRIRGVLGSESADEAAIASVLDTVASHCSNVEDLDISCNSLSLASADAFGRALAALKHPHNVWVNRTKLTDEGMHKFANCLSSMTKCLVPTGHMISHLELLDNDLHAEGISQLVEVVNTGSLPVTRLHLGGNPLGPEGALQLSRLLEFEHCQVCSLGLSKCNLGSQGAIALLRALSSNTSLDDINLTDNDIGKTNETDMSTFIRQLLEPSQVHSCTTGSDLKRFCSTLKPNTHLKYLRISDNYFTGYGIEVLLAFLTVCQSLKNLSSRSCQIGSDDLRYNRFQATFSEGATSNQTLFTHPELQKWSLEDNKIRVDATTVFLKLARTACPQLSCISLHGNPVYGSLEAQGLNLERILHNKFSKEGSHSAELEGRKAFKTTSADSGVYSADSSVHSLPENQSSGIFSSTNSSHSVDAEDTGHKISKSAKPTLQQLLAFPGAKEKIKVHEQIGIKYYELGVFLLEDMNGAKVEAIAMKHSNNAEKISQEILSKWLQGMGKQPVTWSTLIEVLRDIDRNSLAIDLESSGTFSSTTSQSVDEEGAAHKIFTGEKPLQQQLAFSRPQKKIEVHQQPPKSLEVDDMDEHSKATCEREGKTVESDQEGYLRGLDVIGVISVLITSQAQTFQWEGYGLKLNIPQGALPVNLAQCELVIKVGISGQFMLPQNTSLVSAVYWLHTEPQCEFSQPLTVEIQHCAMPSQMPRLSFARCSEKDLPYNFEILEGGEFNSLSAYGRIQLHRFSLISLLKSLPWLTWLLGEDDVKYHARLYYLWKQVTHREIHFVINKDLEAHATVVKQEYNNRGATIGPHQPIEFKLKSIMLQLPFEGLTFEDGWKLYPLFNPRITKEDVDRFEKGREIPSCQLTAEWTKEGKPSRLTYPVTLEGAKEPNDYFYIVLDSTPPNTIWIVRSELDQPQNFQYENVDDTPLGEHSLMTILNSISTLTAKWFNLGLALGLSYGTLRQIESNFPRDAVRCQTEMVMTWLQNSLQPSWRGLASALNSPSVGRIDIATMIATEHPSQ